MINSVCSSCGPQSRAGEILAERLEEKKAENAEALAKREAGIGQQAKEVVAEARETETDLPNNIQGKAASGITRGADAQSLFEALVTPLALDPAIDKSGV